MRTTLYVSPNGMIVGLHAPNWISPPEKLELETTEDVPVTFKVMTTQQRNGNDTVLKLA